MDEISKIAKEHDAFLLMDAVTSFGGCELAIDRWGVDFCYTATQKCIGSPPSLAPVTISDKGMQSVRQRQEKVRSWYVDMDLLGDYWAKTEGKVYHHTIPNASIYGLYEALRIVLEEGQEARFERHRRHGVALCTGLEALGLHILPAKEHRLGQLTAVRIPEGVDDGKVRKRLLDEYNLEIGGGLGQLGGRIWRIGLMGESSKASNVLQILSALEAILPDMGFEVPVGMGVASASDSLAQGC